MKPRETEKVKNIILDKKPSSANTDVGLVSGRTSVQYCFGSAQFITSPPTLIPCSDMAHATVGLKPREMELNKLERQKLEQQKFLAASEAYKAKYSDLLQ